MIESIIIHMCVHMEMIKSMCVHIFMCACVCGVQIHNYVCTCVHTWNMIHAVLNYILYIVLVVWISRSRYGPHVGIPGGVRLWQWHLQAQRNTPLYEHPYRGSVSINSLTSLA